ncbi:MAG: hypothetical protein IPM48_00370 [Saprospiraceae bacterium]|nr:hypothetical protein [Saprospiraceae bacterium]
MKNIFLLFLTFNFTWSTINCFAQIAKIDSLIARINKTNDDTNKVKLYRKLLYQFTIIPSDDPEKYVLPAISLSEKLDFDVFKIKVASGRVYWKLGNWDLA